MNTQVRSELNQYLILLADGDRSAFDFVFETAWPLVHRLAVKMLGARTDTEDVAQQALMKVFSRAQEFDKSRDALAWILGITSYECKTLRQTERRRKEDSSDENNFNNLSDTKLSPEEEQINAELETCIRDLLSTLSPQDQETILISVNELSRPELNAATYRKRLQRAMDKLRSKWKERYE